MKVKNEIEDVFFNEATSDNDRCNKMKGEVGCSSVEEFENFTIEKIELKEEAIEDAFLDNQILEDINSKNVSHILDSRVEDIKVCSEIEFARLEEANVIEEAPIKGFSEVKLGEFESSISEKDKEIYFYCNHCSFKSKRKANLMEHINGLHLKLKNFSCNFCNFKTRYKGSLKHHVKSIHLELKPFECSLCDFKCSGSNNLTLHVKAVHYKLKPIKCTLCEYETCQNSKLKAHTNSIHLRVKRVRNVACQFCNYKAFQISELKSHVEKYHLNILPYVCSQCEFKTSTQYQLRLHINGIHLKLKDVKCTMCDYETTLKSYLRLHMKNKHSDSATLDDESANLKQT